MKFCSLVISLLVVGITTVSAQDKVPVKFGKVSPDDFARKIYSIDSNANAVVIADVGSTEIVGNTKGWFSLEFKRYRRVHILNKNGYDISNVTISLYTSGDDEEKLENLKAVTYNLEDGKVKETKLDTKSGVFKNNVSKKWTERKFTFPDVREGSIIEYEYRIKSDFLFNLRSWEFQGSTPRLWSEYTVTIPQFINYVFMMQGYMSPAVKENKAGQQAFSVTSSGGSGASERYNFTANTQTHRWVFREVPSLKEESFTSTLDNHIAKINFQLSEYREPLTYRNVMGTWTQLAKDMLDADYFGEGLRKDNNWLSEYIGDMVKAGGSKKDIARRIYKYVQDNYTCTNHYGLTISQNLRNIAKSRRGNVAEINLLLTAMLRYADIKADPVIMSTKSNGYTYSLYPLINLFNYVICKASVDEKVEFLDASWPRLGYGKLTFDCYNGHAREISPEAPPLQFVADSLMERKVTSVFIINDEQGKLVGSLQQTPGYYESYRLRNQLAEKGKEQYFTEVAKAFHSDAVIQDPFIDSLDLLDMPVKVQYKFVLNSDKEDIIYFNPMFGEGLKENPFKAAERLYPVEMPFAFDETFLLRMDVPAGYEVDELPKQMVVKLNEYDEGMFEYRITNSNGVISLRSRLRLSRANFQPDEYELLREFFSMVVAKHNEQIVFKKKK